MTDVSKNTVAVLLILVIVISGFSTWSLLSRSSDRPIEARSPKVGPSSAEMGLVVQQPPRGYVVLEIPGDIRG